MIYKLNAVFTLPLLLEALPETLRATKDAL